jgi:hypothetical protein
VDHTWLNTVSEQTSSVLPACTKSRTYSAYSSFLEIGSQWISLQNNDAIMGKLMIYLLFGRLYVSNHRKERDHPGVDHDRFVPVWYISRSNLLSRELKVMSFGNTLHWPQRVWVHECPLCYCSTRNQNLSFYFLRMIINKVSLNSTLKFTIKDVWFTCLSVFIICHFIPHTM